MVGQNLTFCNIFGLIMLLGIQNGNNICRSPGKISWKRGLCILLISTWSPILKRLQIFDGDKIEFFGSHSDKRNMGISYMIFVAYFFISKFQGVKCFLFELSVVKSNCITSIQNHLDNIIYRCWVKEKKTVLLSVTLSIWTHVYMLE